MTRTVKRLPTGVDPRSHLWQRGHFHGVTGQAKESNERVYAAGYEAGRKERESR